MKVIFRARADLLAATRADLGRRHRFAAERVGFFICRAGRLNDGLVILAAEYEPVADDDYLPDRSVGAMMGPSAIRKAMQRAYASGAEDVAMFHVHVHEHRGMPIPSPIDRRESQKFVPDFFNVAPNMPHGIVVLSHDRGVGLCWPRGDATPVPFETLSSVGAPLAVWRTDER